MRVPIRLLALVALLAASAPSLPRATGRAAEDPPGRIAFVRDGDVWVWSGGDEERLFRDGAASDPRWSPSGQELLFVRAGDSYSNLVLRYLEAGGEVALTANQPGYQIGSPEYAANSVWAIDPAWSPSGLIAFASDYYTPGGTMTLWLIPDLSGGAVPALAAQDEGHISNVCLSRDGSIAGYTVRGTTPEGFNTTYVALRDLNDGLAYVIADDPGGAFDPAISPDDRRVAVSIRAADGMTDIWLVDRQTGDRTRVTENAQATNATWSPDGAWLAYLRMVDYRFEIWAVPVDGTVIGEPSRLARYNNLDPTSGLSWTYG